MKKIRYYLFLLAMLLSQVLHAQLCGNPGINGPEYISVPQTLTYNVNTYFPINGDLVLPGGSKSIVLGAVLPPPSRGANYGTDPVGIGDLLLIIQMQDATFNSGNDASYGSGNATSGPDGLGGTGYTSIGNSGKYEYVVATSTLPLKGGTLTFRGAGLGGGTVNTYTSSAATASRGARSFQVIRVPQYSNLYLKGNLTSPGFNGKCGGVIAFNVAGKMEVATQSRIDAGGAGFRASVTANLTPEANIKDLYAIPATDNRVAGKAEGIAGTPASLPGGGGYPGGDNGRGAPGNAGGGGKTLVSGAGGGGNGGAGGMGRTYPVKDGEYGGRPGSAVYRSGTADIDRLIMGGGSGAGGDFGSSSSGGGIILINAGTLTGNFDILSTGQGGGGAGGTIFLNVKRSDPSLILNINASGSGAGAMNGAGGGGQVFHTLTAGTLTISANGGEGVYGLDDSNPDREGNDGQPGHVVFFTESDLPPYLRTGCYPELTTIMTEANPGVARFPGNEASYQVKITNPQVSGGAINARADILLPTGFTLISATAAYTNTASGPATLTNLGTPERPFFGDFYIPQDAEVTITLNTTIGCSVPAGLYHASVQVGYADPSRALKARAVKAALNAFTDAGTIYQTTYDAGGPSGPVAGSNYDGTQAAATSEDVKVVLPLIKSNKIDNPAATGPYCKSYDPPLITGQEAEVDDGAFSYQWESSLDGIKYTEIAGATSRDYDPPVINDTTYYRRQVAQHGCTTASNASNVVRFDVNPAITLDFDVPALCVMDGVAKFTNKTLNSAGNTTGLTYLWNFGDSAGSDPGNPNTAMTRDGSHNYTTAGIYTVTLVVTKDGYCVQTPLPKQVLISSVPVADYQISPTSLCSGAEVTFKDKSTIEFGELSKIEWHFDDSDPAAVFIDPAPAKRNEPPKDYKHIYPEFHSPAVKTITGRMLAYSGTACVSEKVFTITLKATPELVFDPVASVCPAAQKFKLNAGRETGGAVTGIGRYSGKGIEADGVTFDPAVAGPGSHTLVYTFTPDAGGCPGSITGIVEVSAPPRADAGADKAISKGGSVQLGGAAAGSAGSAQTYKWTPATGLDRDDVPDPMASPDHDITYRLTVTTVQGCVAFDDVEIKVLQHPEIPGAFSPNGDGINDYWNIKYLYPQATVTIYNRYGELVFSFTANTKSWDGKHNGKQVPAGVYYYLIDPHNGVKRISGSIMVLR